MGCQGAPCSPFPITAAPQGTVLCDIILLNFLKGAEHYKARKFEEVSWLLGTPRRGDPKAPSTLGATAAGQGVTLRPFSIPQVPEASVPPASSSPSGCTPGALGDQSREKQSTDSGTFSLGL